MPSESSLLVVASALLHGGMLRISASVLFLQLTNLHACICFSFRRRHANHSHGNQFRAHSGGRCRSRICHHHGALLFIIAFYHTNTGVVSERSSLPCLPNFLLWLLAAR